MADSMHALNACATIGSDALKNKSYQNNTSWLKPAEGSSSGTSAGRETAMNLAKLCCTERKDTQIHDLHCLHAKIPS